MSKVCPQCACRNPDEACFCCFDGVPLSGGDRIGPLQAGTLPFLQPFIFPSGEMCRNFNQLTMSCQRNWDESRELLVRGDLRRFLKGIGRADLARTAKQAVDTLDPDQALDELLGKFPADVLHSPSLAVEPTQVNLGQVRPGADTAFDLLVSNVGMRLLIGTVSTDCDWLLIGDGPGQKKRLFQTTGETRIAVKVAGAKLRAGPRPLVGRLLVESSVGFVSVKVELRVPIQPFPEGILQGAATPRELALKARDFPREAAMLFEKGAVADWYRGNGWIYPVDGPSGSGLGAVQQFFEALGLTKPPRVAISDDSLAFTGIMGDRIPGQLRVSTPDKRPVFAHAWCDQPWVTFAEPQFQGATVRLPFEVEVPPRPGEILEGKITVRANGNQRFQVPIFLAVDNVRVTATKEPAAPARDSFEPAAPARGSFEPAAPARGRDSAESLAGAAGSSEVPSLAGAAGSSEVPSLAGAAGSSEVPSLAGAAGSKESHGLPSLAGAAGSSEGEGGTFGMARLIYWSSLIGGWSAFVGWLIAEVSFGSSVGSTGYLVAMIVLVASALGAGLSQTEGLLTARWQGQLRQLGPGLLGGFVGGLIGGMYGNILHERLAFLGFLSRVLGWTMLGLCIGVCQGILHGLAEGDWRKFRNGLIGGSLGGFLGGLCFDPVGWLIGSPISSRAVAFVLLGLSIGLFLSLVQVLLKEAWLTVEEGFRPGRQLILDQPVVTMGTSEKANLIFIAYGARGVEPVHLRIRRRKNGEYVLRDNGSRGGTFLNGKQIDSPSVLADGDVIQLGINKVRFRERVRRRPVRTPATS